MKFKKNVYNIIFSVLLVLVIGAFGISTYVIAVTPEVVVPDVGNSGSGGNTGDQNNTSQPTVPSNPSQPDEEPALPDEEFDPNVPSYKYPIKLLNYAFDKLYDGEGYKSNYSAVLTNDAIVLGSKITVKQYVSGTADKCKDKAYEIFKFKAEGPMSDQASNYIRGYYKEGNSYTRYQTPDFNYDFSSAMKTEFTEPEFIDAQAFLVAERPLIDFSTQYFNATTLTQIDQNGKEYYIINAKVINTAVWTDRYLHFFESTGDMANVRGIDATYTFYIYKDNAQIFKMQTEGNLVGTNPAFGVTVESHVSATQVITLYNQEIDIKKP